MSYTNPIDLDEDDDEYSSVLDDAELTGKEPKFLKMKELDVTTNQLAEMPVVDMVQLYRDLRDQLATDRHGYKSREKVMKTQLEIISMSLRDRADQLGVDSFKTPAGTAFRNTKEKFTVADWEALTDYIASSGNYQLLQKRVSGTAAKEIREEDGELPPGVGSLVEIEFGVRAPAKRSK